MAWTPGQKYLAEFLGTFGLLFSVTGAAVFTATYGLDPAARVLMISISIGLGLMAMIYAFGDISGGHFNPAVTIAMILAGRIQVRDAGPYIAAQILGAITAVGVVAGIAYGYSVIWAGAISPGLALASQGYGGNGSPWHYAIDSVFLIEVVITFLLVITILYATRSDSFAKNLAPVGIGFVLLMINLVAIPVDGASANPARSFAPAVLSAYWSGDQWAITQVWIFFVAPIVGAILAGLVERFLRSGGSAPAPT